MEIKRNCTFCDNRHFGCALGDDDYERLFEDNSECESFVLGKCYYCAMYALNDDALCNDVMFPCGCENFKETNEYDEYLEERYYDPCDINTADMVNRMTYHKAKEHKKALTRRKKDKKHKEKMKRKARENKGYVPGPYFDEEKNRVIISGRGRASKWLKQIAHKKVRNQKIDDNEELYQRGQHKKLFDYWWELF